MEYKLNMLLNSSSNNDQQCTHSMLKRLKEDYQMEGGDHPVVDLNKSPLKRSKTEDSLPLPHTSFSPSLLNNIELLHPSRHNQHANSNASHNHNHADHMCPSRHSDKSPSNVEGRLDQRVADNWEDDLSDEAPLSDEEYEGDDFDDEDGGPFIPHINSFHFHSQFDEMSARAKPRPDLFSLNDRPQFGNSGAATSPSKPKVAGSASSTPTQSPKSNPGTPGRPFPALDYKMRSEQVKQNTDGTYSCPYETCNKTIKGNKGNLSSHLRWHRRLDAEADESKGILMEEQEDEEFTTPMKPSQRGVQLRNQMITYGLNVFRQDSQGKYLCFFEGCNLRMLTNFSRHIAKHERKGDRVKEDLILNMPKKLAMSMPSTPTTSSSLSSPISLLSHSTLSTPNLSPLQDSFKPKTRKPLSLTINTQSPPIWPYSRSISLSKLHPLSSPQMEDGSSKSRIDTLVESNNNMSDILVPGSHSSSPRSKSSLPMPLSPNAVSFRSTTTSAATNNTDIQWVYKIPNTPTSTPCSPRVSFPPLSVVPSSPSSLSYSSSSCSSTPSSQVIAPMTPTSQMNFQFSKLRCRSREDEVAKSLITLGH
ncbi:hypothetical protein SAMD00019534_085780, partial [Acytostelium subglobosum LB1]|uniref:hypothetical protein n=1 Tax=Acytostelium subglobosum LB1 TaxID=1410327 RepID=UPI000644EF94